MTRLIRIPLVLLCLGLSFPALGQEDETFSFTAEGIDIKEALALFARTNGLNIVADPDIAGTIHVSFRDLPLQQAMRALLDAHGYYFEQDGPLLRVRDRMTRIFEIDYLHIERQGAGSNVVQISTNSGSRGGSSSGGSSGSSSGENGSSMRLTATSSTDFWGNIAAEIEALLSENGTYTTNSLSGTILVSDHSANVRRIGDYLEKVDASITRQVDLEVEIYEVGFFDENQLGVDWTAITEALNSTIATDLRIDTPVFGSAPGSASFTYNGSQGDTNVIVEALAQQGDLDVVSKPRLRTLNNQPAVIRVGQERPLFSQTSEIVQTGDADPIIQFSVERESVTIGTVLAITPQISKDGMITLDITPAVSRLVSEIEIENDSGSSTGAVIDIRQASSLVRVMSGDTIIIGGLVQESTNNTTRKVPLLGDIPALGRLFRGTYESVEKTELVIFLTPRVVADF